MDHRIINQMAEFLLRLIEIRENLDRTPKFNSSIVLTSVDIKNIILKKKEFFGITNLIEAKSKVIEMLDSIKDDWDFVTNNKIGQGTLSFNELQNGSIEVIGYQTKILELYLLKKLGMKRNKKANKSNKAEFKDNFLSFNGNNVPMFRGQGMMCDLLFKNAEIIGGKKPRRGIPKSVVEIRNYCNYKNSDTFREALKMARTKIKVFNGVITIPPPKKTGRYHMCINYNK